MAIAYFKTCGLTVPLRYRPQIGNRCSEKGSDCLRKLLTPDVPAYTRADHGRPQVIKAVVLVAKDQGIVFRDILVDYFQRWGVDEISRCVEKTVLEDGVVVLKAEVLRVPLADELNQYFHEFPARQFGTRVRVEEEVTMLLFQLPPLLHHRDVALF